MKKTKMLVTIPVACLALAGLASCSSGSSPKEEGVIKVRLYKGGHGRAWFDQIAANFVKLYPDVKISVESYSKDAGDLFSKEIKVPDDNDIDLYFVSGANTPNIIPNSYNILDTDDPLLEPLDDIINSPAIKNDGTEETETIGSRFFSGYLDASKYHVELKNDAFEGKTFELSWSDCMTGIVCNTTKLTELGFSVPLTTNELIATSKAIHESNSGIEPWVFAGKNASGYLTYLFNTWFAQYDGIDSYRDFVRCKPTGEGKTISDNGYEVYEKQGILKSLEAMIPLCNFDYNVEGSGGFDYDKAQYEFYKQNAVFMANGDWLLREEYDIDQVGQERYDVLKNFEMIRTPILSSIGTEIGLNDSQLHTLVEMIDTKKTDDEIKTSIPSLTNEQILRVRKARGVYYSEGNNHSIIMPSYSNTKDLAKKFVRFMYSNESCNIFHKTAFANLPVSYTPDIDTNDTKFSQSLNKIYDNEYISVANIESHFNEIRMKGGVRLFNYNDWSSPTTFMLVMRNQDTASPWTAQYMFEKEAKSAKDNWSSYIKKCR